MNINFQESEDLSPLINNYYAHTPDGLSNLSSQLKNVDTRIKFEEWLINNFSPEEAIDTDFEWQSKVITMLVTNLTESSTSRETRRNEDLLIAGLISKASPLAKKDQGILDRGARLVQHAAGMILNSKQIAKELKNADMPFTSTVLLRRILEYQDISTIMGQAIEDNNIAMVKAIIQQYPEEFKAALVRQNKIINGTPVHSAVNSNRIEILKLMAEAMPEAFSAALTMQNKDGDTPIHIASCPRYIDSYNNYIDIIKLMAKAAPEAFSAALILQDNYGNTPVYAACDNDTIIKFFHEVAPEAFSAALILQNIFGNTPVYAACDRDLKDMVKFFHEVAPEAFSAALTLQDNNGNTPVLSACDKNNIDMLKLMAKAAPEAFSAALTLQDNKGNTPVLLASFKNNIDVIKLMAKAAPEAFSATLTLQNNFGNSSVLYASHHNNIDMLKLMAKAAPEAFSAALTLQDNNGNTPVLSACFKNNIDMIKLMAEVAPEAFSAALTLQNNQGNTPVILASDNKNIDMIKLMAKAAPEAISAALTLQDKNGSTPVFLASYKNNIDMIKLMAEVAPEAFSAALTLQDNNGNTPVLSACDKNNIDMIKLMAKAAPEAFSAALTLQNKGGLTPALLACNKNYIDMIKLMAEVALEALAIRDNEGNSGLDFLKNQRSHNYKQITGLFNINLKRENKEIVSRKALSHAYHISGTSRLIANDTKTKLVDLNLEGWLEPQWFHMLGKDLNPFMSSYPDLLTKDEMSLLKDVFHMGANPESYSLEDKLQRIKDGKPTIINTGFLRHAVTLLIWGDLFLICNRGAATRRPVDFFHFDPQKIDLEDLKKIIDVSAGASADYMKLFFEELPTKLMLSKTPLDYTLEQNNHILPDQTVSNCSFVSPITAVYALKLLEKVQGVNFEHRLLDGTDDKALLAERIEKASKWYQTWLAFEQITILERNIQPLEKGNLNFEPDHKLITEGLRKAHLLPLDDLCSQKLEVLEKTYLNSLDKNAQTELKTDLTFWKALWNSFHYTWD